MLNVCPIQESEGTSCNLAGSVTAGTELLQVQVNTGNRNWYLVELTGIVELDQSSVTVNPAFDLYVDGKSKCSLPQGTFNTKLVLQASKQISIVCSRNLDASELLQVTYMLTVTRIKPICCERD